MFSIFYSPTGLTMFKTKNSNNTISEDSEANPVLNDYRSRKMQAKEAEHITNSGRKEPMSHVRPSSAKYEPRSRTPGVIGSANSNVNRREHQYSSNVSTGANSINSRGGESINKPKISHGVNNHNNVLNKGNNVHAGSNQNNRYNNIPYNSNNNGLSRPIRSTSARPTPSNIQSNNIRANNYNSSNVRNDNRSVSPGKVLSAHTPSKVLPQNYEYKSPYKSNNVGQIQRPSSSRDRNIPSSSNNHQHNNHINNQINSHLNNHINIPLHQPSNPVLINQRSKGRLIQENSGPEHKALIQPIRIIDNPKRIPSAQNPNNFLKGGAAGGQLRPPTSDHTPMLKLVQNNQPRLINLYKK